MALPTADFESPKRSAASVKVAERAVTRKMFIPLNVSSVMQTYQVGVSATQKDTRVLNVKG